MHGVGLESTYEGLDSFFKGDKKRAQYWVAYEDNIPFGFLISSEVDPSEEILKDIPLAGNKIFGLDVFIGEESFLGIGLGKRMIREFLKEKFPQATDFLIDPEASNKRAIHVYEKLGFRFMKEFIAPWHPVPHHLMHVKKVRFFNSGIN